MGGAKPKRSDNHARMSLSLALPPKGAGQHRHGGKNIRFPLPPAHAPRGTSTKQKYLDPGDTSTYWCWVSSQQEGAHRP